MPDTLPFQCRTPGFRIEMMVSILAHGARIWPKVLAALTPARASRVRTLRFDTSARGVAFQRRRQALSESSLLASPALPNNETRAADTLTRSALPHQQRCCYISASAPRQTHR